MSERKQDVEHRRKFKRHPVRWKAAVVFNSADGKPVLHTQTLDLSAGGTAIQCDYADLVGTSVTLLLARPANPGAEAPKLLKMPARVVSSAHLPAESGFRYGLRFVPSEDEDLGAFAKLIAAAATTAPATTAAPVGEETPAFDAAPGGLLAQLRQAAAAKLAEDKKKPDTEEQNALVGAALERAYRHLKNFAQPFVAGKPPYGREYSIAGMTKFDGLKWEECDVDFHAREVSATKKLFDRVTLIYRLSAGKELRVTREIPSDAKLKQLLLDTGVAFTTQGERNERGTVVKTTFVVPCEIKASLQLLANFDSGKLLLKMRNVEHFGTVEHVIAPESVTDESLSELTRLILGEARRIGPLLLKDA